MTKTSQNYGRTHEGLHTGFSDHLTPLKPLDLNKIKKFSDLTDAMSNTAFGGRLVGEAVETLVAMSKDKDTFVILTLSGAMTVAKMGLLVTDMIEKGLVNAVISTGALMAHGLVESQGMSHFKVPHNMDDKEMYLAGYNRVYDTIELEQNLDNTEEMFFKILDKINPEKVLSSRFLNEEIGKYLSKNTKHRGILKSAYEKGVPVFVPAFTDSELGLDLALYNRLRLDEGQKIRKFDPFLDLEHYSHLIDKQKKIGIFTIGGGVPRNWAQQVTCYLDIIEQRKAVRGDPSTSSTLSKAEVLRVNKNKVEKVPLMFSYGLRICPEPVEWGGLSGCTYTEGISWGKFQPHELGSRFCEVPADATVVWPLILKSALEKLGKKKIKKNIFAGKKAVLEIEEEVEKNYQIHNL